MWGYVFRRLLRLPLVLLAVSFVTFTLGHYGPGDPVEVLMGQKFNQEVADRIRRERGLDRPFHEQYISYIGGVLQGDFGESYKFQGQPVLDLVLPKAAVSAQLGLAVILISTVVAIPLGLVAAIKQGTWVDPSVVIVTLFFMSVPAFITMPFFVIVFVRTLHVLPTTGWGGMLAPQIVMPALVMSLGAIGSLTRLMRASTMEVIGQDFVRTARSKGLLERVVLFRHVARNALIPIITVIGLSLATLVEGAFIVETFFGIPGIGAFAVDSFFSRDYPVIMALVLMIAASYVVFNLLVDLVYPLLDPRIRLR